MILTTNVLLISVKTRNSAVWISERLSALFHVSYRTNQLFDLLKASKFVISKLEIADELKQDTEDAAEEF